MIRLHPIPDCDFRCPYCGGDRPLQARGWYVPGNRTLADLTCVGCGREFFGDLPSAFGLYYPCLLDKATSEVFDPNKAAWHAAQLRDAYAGRHSKPLKITVESFKTVRRPLVLNTLDSLYGHAVQKLFNSQHAIDHLADCDLILIVPRFLRWMVPDGAAEIWTLDVPLRECSGWNDWLAAELARRISDFGGEAMLSLSFICPHPSRFDVERFTRVKPFDPDDWVRRRQRPAVTFIWRDDRTWPDVESMRAPLRYMYKAGMKISILRAWTKRRLAGAQRRRVIELAETLRASFAGLDFAVLGPGARGDLPNWILDLRTLSFSPEQELEWCRRYAASHMVIGIHGSNLVLPSAHAGSLIELVPDDRWAVLGTTVYPQNPDVKQATYRYLFIPANASPGRLSTIASEMLRYLPFADLFFCQEYTDHERVARDTSEISRRWRQLHLD